MALRCHELRPPCGYSLIEVLVAASMLILGLAGLSSGLSTLREASARADRLAESAAIAAAWIDRLQRAEPGSVLSMSACAAGEPACAAVPGGVRRVRTVDAAGDPASVGPFDVSWTILRDRPRVGAREVRLSVLDRAGRSGPFEVVTHVR